MLKLPFGYGSGALVVATVVVVADAVVVVTVVWEVVVVVVVVSAFDEDSSDFLQPEAATTNIHKNKVIAFLSFTKTSPI